MTLPPVLRNVKIKVRNQYGEEYVMKCNKVYVYEPRGLNSNPLLYYHVFECTVIKSTIPELPKGEKIDEAWLPKSAEIISSKR